MPVFPPGTLVGARRWPSSTGHPDSWGQPHVGIALPQDDPRAWADTGAFAGTPSQEAVRAHLAAVGPSQHAEARVPVLWLFPAPQRYQVFWEMASTLRTAEDDYASWESLRSFMSVTLNVLAPGQPVPAIAA